MVDFKSHIRELKLKIISEDLQFKIDESSVDKFKKELDFILANFKDDIISGSLALNLYGLIDRQINDIDILIKDKDRYSDYNFDGYDELIENRLGYKEFDWRKNIFSKKQHYSADFFIDKGVSYNIFEYSGNLLKVHNPLEIIELKNNLKAMKNKSDLFSIFLKCGIFDK
jgi:hypothetical protein